MSNVIQPDTRNEAIEFIDWCLAQTEGEAATIGNWLVAQKYQGNVPPFENVAHIRRSLPWHGPNIANWGTVFDAALAVYRVS